MFKETGNLCYEAKLVYDFISQAKIRYLHNNCRTVKTHKTYEKG